MISVDFCILKQVGRNTEALFFNLFQRFSTWFIYFSQWYHMETKLDKINKTEYLTLEGKYKNNNNFRIITRIVIITCFKQNLFSIQQNMRTKFKIFFEVVYCGSIK